MKKNKKAFITGIGGQDGYFLSQLLLEKGYDVYGLIRKNKKKQLGTLELLKKEQKAKIKIIWGDIIDSNFIKKTIKSFKFDEIYHFAAISSVAFSFENPQHTFDVNIGGTLNIIESIRKYSPKSKFYFAATSELFGDTKYCPQDENTSFSPASPYAISKLAGFWTTRTYRESYNLFMVNGILFNHESEIRGPEFVTRKITLGVAEIKKGLCDYIELGNLDAKRDWGYAKDYVKGMWMMMQQKNSEDFILATGENHTIREFVELAFKAVKVDICWKGHGLNEVGKDKKTGKILVKINPEYFRPNEINNIRGNYSKAKKKLKWEPKVKLQQLIKIMVKKDLEDLS